jgi:preprotein translocase subunit SecG
LFLKKATSVMLALFIALSIPIVSVVSATDAAAWGRRGHHGYYKKQRGETSWRTNRSTGARFRIC